MASLAEKALSGFLRTHDAIYQKTNGWVGHHFPPLAPSLLLHTVGAKTGKHRTTSLSYARDGDDYLIVASKGGDNDVVRCLPVLAPTVCSSRLGAKGGK